MLLTGEYRVIPLKSATFGSQETMPNIQAIVDLEDYDVLRQYTWKAVELSKNRWTAVTYVDGKKVYMSRLVTNTVEDDDVYIKFRDGDALDCRRQNLVVYRRVKTGG